MDEAQEITDKLFLEINKNPFKFVLKHMVDFFYDEEKNEIIVGCDPNIESKDFQMLCDFDNLTKNTKNYHLKVNLK